MALEDAQNQADRAIDGPDRGLAFENPFAGATSFLRRRYSRTAEGADLVFTGIPFDQAVTHRPGARFGPRAIREASTLQPGDPPYGWDFDALSEFAMFDCGDMPFDYADVSSVPAAIEAHVGRLAAQAPVVTLGGDHSITLPILRAMAARHGPLGVIQFDAHSDLWPDSAPARRVDHGTFVGKAVAEGVVDPARSVQIGLRTTCEDPHGFTQIDARAVHERGVAAVVAEAKRVLGDGPCYLTFDIDALDPAFAPGTGTPVWGGLASWQAAAMLRDLAGIALVGGDVVEVAPAYDTTGATAIAGAHVATEIACLALWPRRAR